MLVKRSLQTGLITGLGLTLIALLCTFFFQQVRPVWPVMFAPVFVTGVYALLRSGRAVENATDALLAGALGGLAAATLSFLGFSLAVIIQVIIPNWPYPGSTQATPGGALALITILSEGPPYIPREALLLDLPLALPFPWPYVRTLPDGNVVSRLP